MNKRQILMQKLIWLCNTQSMKQGEKTAIFEQIGAILSKEEVNAQ